MPLYAELLAWTMTLTVSFIALAILHAVKPR